MLGSCSSGSTICSIGALSFCVDQFSLNSARMRLPSASSAGAARGVELSGKLLIFDGIAGHADTAGAHDHVAFSDRRRLDHLLDRVNQAAWKGGLVQDSDPLGRRSRTQRALPRQTLALRRVSGHVGESVEKRARVSARSQLPGWVQSNVREPSAQALAVN